MMQIFIKCLAVLNMLEGIIHIVCSLISFWGIYAIGVWDWRVATSPTTDIFLGVLSIVTAIVLGKWHPHCLENE